MSNNVNCKPFRFHLSTTWVGWRAQTRTSFKSQVGLYFLFNSFLFSSNLIMRLIRQVLDMQLLTLCQPIFWNAYIIVGLKAPQSFLGQRELYHHLCALHVSGAQRKASELGIVLVAPDTSPRGLGVPGESDSWDFGVGAGFYINATVWL
jgi:hypothetical protein